MAVKTDFHEFARHDRYRAFEILLWWEGSCNASDLSALFNVRRENVSRDIRAYREQHGEHVVYDSVAKTYRPKLGFNPVYSTGRIVEYVAFTRRFNLEASWEGRATGWLDSGPQPHIEPDPLLFRALVQSIRNQQLLDIRYRSWNHPQGQDRRIHPHALAYSGLRWHCRAYDERTDSYRDFHLGRFERYEIATALEGVSGDEDADWHTMITIELEPNPALNEGEQRLVMADFGLGEGTLSVRCRRAMAQYVLQSFRVDPDLDLSHQAVPRKNPLVVKNYSMIQAFSWS